MFSFWVNCKNCTESYEVSIGELSYGDYPSYCDTCGNFKIVPVWESMIHEEILECECGGLYEKDSKPKCPKCQCEEYIEDRSKPQTLSD